MLELTSKLNFNFCQLSCKVIVNELLYENLCLHCKELQLTLLCPLAVPWLRRDEPGTYSLVCALVPFGWNPGRHRAFQWAWCCRKQWRWSTPAFSWNTVLVIRFVYCQQLELLRIMCASTEGISFIFICTVIVGYTEVSDFYVYISSSGADELEMNRWTICGIVGGGCSCFSLVFVFFFN